MGIIGIRAVVGIVVIIIRLAGIIVAVITEITGIIITGGLIPLG